jgi:light-regulated signal transduction histidine kinase (bacteriophytochrome)
MKDFDMLAKQLEQAEVRALTGKKDQKKKFEKASPRYLLLVLLASVIFQILSFLVIVKELRRRFAYQKELEKNINELNMSHAELEQIAFIATHDLQEPLRKMRTFSGRLLSLFKDQLNDEGKSILNKIDFAATRMQGLILDVVDYTNLINSNEPLETVDLEVCIRDVRENLSNLLAQQKVLIVANNLPQIKGYLYQLQLLFTNLVHNSIKFSKEGIDPVITITAEQIKATHPYRTEDNITEETFLLIRVVDNGIGFENEFAEKIFVMFQRLHGTNTAYEGKGIGLSICKRVMSNHNGFISAEGELGKGATFNLFFPI